MANPVTVEDRFWSKVNKTDSCWLWTGGKHKRGHGRIKINGKYILAHRFSYELVYGPVPKDLQVCHNCPGGDNPSCVNPDHLFIGTARDNIEDAIKKGRITILGTRQNAILNEEKVREIRKLHEAGELNGHQIAKLFNVKPGTIYNVILKRKWGWVE